jgi:hypothetical protein
MNQHPYLRAYMAGITVPSMLLLIILGGFLTTRYGFHVAIPIERAIVFPMALVPNIFGVWNVFYLWLRPRPHLPIGFHGALLPFLLAPTGFVLATSLGVLSTTQGGVIWFHELVVPYAFFLVMFPTALVAYYLIWKYLVGFFNEVLGIA